MADPLQPHRLNYLVVSRSSRRNQTPATPAPGHAVTAPYDWSRNELKFQLSVKREVYRDNAFERFGLGFDLARLWLGYTQQSHWQMFDFSNSSPFRETNYQPEAILSLRNANHRTSSFKLLNIAFEHQSNGRSNPDSRSWWRAYVQGGWEWERSEKDSPKGEFALLARTWLRTREGADQDDNPDIKHYVGRAEVQGFWRPGAGYEASALLRHNLNLRDSHGFLQLDLKAPAWCSTGLRPYLQYTTGNGETLIDYNFRQWTLGFGFALDIGDRRQSCPTRGARGA